MTLNCKGQLVDISIPKVMGILNITPDSFYDGGRYKDESTILRQVERMLSDGATFIDIGGYSSRPGADHISTEEELNRVIPIIELLMQHHPNCLISVDTFRSKVAKMCVEAGAALVNDISSGQLDQEMMQTVGELRVPFIMMHMLGTPQTMMDHTNYEDLMKSMLSFFSERIAIAKEHGILDIVIDPGFGFSKTLEQNYQLLNALELLQIIERPILVGLSRKSMIYKVLETTPEKALNGTSTLHAIALLKGASILRVHDVKEAYECITLVNQLP